jgi:hypothetical protein
MSHFQSHTLAWLSTVLSLPSNDTTRATTVTSTGTGFASHILHPSRSHPQPSVNAPARETREISFKPLRSLAHGSDLQPGHEPKRCPFCKGLHGNGEGVCCPRGLHLDPSRDSRLGFQAHARFSVGRSLPGSSSLGTHTFADPARQQYYAHGKSEWPRHPHTADDRDNEGSWPPSLPGSYLSGLSASSAPSKEVPRARKRCQKACANCHRAKVRCRREGPDDVCEYAFRKDRQAETQPHTGPQKGKKQNGTECLPCHEFGTSCDDLEPCSPCVASGQAKMCRLPTRRYPGFGKRPRKSRAKRNPTTTSIDHSVSGEQSGGQGLASAPAGNPYYDEKTMFSSLSPVNIVGTGHDSKVRGQLT